MSLGSYETITCMGYGATGEEGIFDFVVLAGEHLGKIVKDDGMVEPFLYIFFLENGNTKALISDQVTNTEYHDFTISNEVIEYARRYLSQVKQTHKVY